MALPQNVPYSTPWRDDRVVDGSSLENCQTRKGLEGSNPSPSAIFEILTLKWEGILFTPFDSFVFMKRKTCISALIVLLVSSLSLSVAEAAVPMMLLLAQPELSCDGERGIISLEWDSEPQVEHFTVSRKYSWKEGWVTVAEDISDQSFVDQPVIPTPRKYVYKVTTTFEGQEYSSNSVRIDTAPCFPEKTEEPVVFHDPVIAFLKEIPRNLWGAIVGYGKESGDAFEALVQEAMSARSADVYWGNEKEFPIDLADAYEGKTMVLFWNPGDYNSESVDQPQFSYASILRGDFDSYITEFAAKAKEYGKPVILVPFPEMNGNWYPWGGTVNGNTADSFVAAYRYIHRFFSDVPNVLFGWSVTNESYPDIGTNSIAGYYPGSTYVDIVGVKGYNYGDPWASFHDVFAPSLYTFQIFQKPIMIFGMGTVEGERKAEWITDALNLQVKIYPEIIGWLWDNTPYDEKYNWRVESSPESLDAFRKAVKN